MVVLRSVVGVAIACMLIGLPAQLAWATPPTPVSVFNFSGGFNQPGGDDIPLLNGDLLGTVGSGSGEIIGFRGTVGGAPEATYLVNSGFNVNQPMSYSGNYGNYSTNGGLNFSISVGDSTYAYLYDSSISGGGTLFLVARDVTTTGGFVPQEQQRYEVTSVPEIDGSVLARASLVIFGFAALMLLGARRFETAGVGHA